MRSAIASNTDLTWWQVGHAGSTWLRSDVCEPINSTSKPSRRRSSCVCSNCGQNCQNTPYSVTRDCTREFNASVAIVHLSSKLQNACHSFFHSERQLLTRIRYLSQFAQALASFGAGEILQGSECRRLDHRAPQGAPGTRPSSVWCATPNGKQISTKRRDVRFSPTCQSRRSYCCRPTQRENSC